jgi:hypothetical protein
MKIEPLIDCDRPDHLLRIPKALIRTHYTKCMFLSDLRVAIGATEGGNIYLGFVDSQERVWRLRRQIDNLISLERPGKVGIVSENLPLVKSRMFLQ